MIGAVIVVLNLVRLAQQHAFAFFNFWINKISSTVFRFFYKNDWVGLFE